MRKLVSILFLIVTIHMKPVLGAEDNPGEAADREVLNKFIDGFHQAAAQANQKRYLAHFAGNGVFMGTDDWERWPLEPDFRAYVAQRFKDGKGWTYKAVERHIAFSPDRKVAWFDEITKSEKWGLFRGTGVVLKQDTGWKLAHYSMSVLVPNEVWVAVSDLNKAAIIRRQQKKK